MGGGGGGDGGGWGGDAYGGTYGSAFGDTSIGGWGDATYGGTYGGAFAQGIAGGAVGVGTGGMGAGTAGEPGALGEATFEGLGDTINYSLSNITASDVLGMALGFLGNIIGGPIGGIAGSQFGQALGAGATGNTASGPGAWGGSDAGGGYGGGPSDILNPGSQTAIPDYSSGVPYADQPSYYSSPDFSSLAGSLVSAKDQNSGYRRLGTESMLDTGYLGNIYDLNMRLR